MATPGTYISVLGHIGLVAWLLSGWGLQSEPLPMEVTEVSIVTSEEYARLTAATTPDPSEVAPEAPSAPVVEDRPEAAAPEEQVAAVQPPAPVTPPVEDLPPPPAPEPPAPVEEVVDLAPSEPVAPTPEILAPVTRDTPTPDAAPRVAPEPVAAPEPDTQIADRAQEPATPTETAPEAEPVEPVEATAPEEATTEIVTEAETPSGAVEVSMRPQVRPNRPEPQPEPDPEPTSTSDPDPTPTSDPPPAPDPTPAPDPEAETSEQLAQIDADVDAAVASVLESIAPEGPPMNASEEAGFRVSVQNCWNVGSMSTAAQQVKVTVAFELDRDRKVVGNAVRLVGSEGGDAAAVNLAFATARRAILQCQNRGNGFDLPALKYERWKEVELTFDPSAMRLR